MSGRGGIRRARASAVCAATGGACVLPVRVCVVASGSTAGRVVARLLLFVAMVASELIGARAVCGRTAWECARRGGGTMLCVRVCVR